MSDDQYRPLPDFRQLEDAVADLARQDIVLAVANDLYRDRYRLASISAALRGYGMGDDLVIVAPARGGQLRGASFLGLPVVEGDVVRCLVAVGAPDDLRPVDTGPRCSTCGQPMSSPGCTLTPGDRRVRAEAGFHTIAGPGPIEAGD